MLIELTVELTKMKDGEKLIQKAEMDVEEALLRANFGGNDK